MKRREFLKTAAIAGAGAIVASCGFNAARKESGNQSGNQSEDLSGNQSGSRPVEAPNINTLPTDAVMRLSFEPYELQLAHTFTVSSNSRKTTPDVQLRIDYGGYTGYGEASMPPYLGHSVDSVCSFLSKVNLEQFHDPFCIEDIIAYVDSLSDGDAPAKAAVDIALHDLVGKIIGQPLYRIWGYDRAKAGDTTFTIGIDSPEVVKVKTLECAGKFNILKVKVGLDNDKEMIETIRSITDLPIAVDANQGWKNKLEALNEILWLHSQGVVMVEQPMPVTMIDDIAWLTERSPIPIFADEAVQRLSDIHAVKGAYSGINIKLMKCTGLLEARKMLTYARAEGMKVMIGCMTETSCAVTAAAHLSPAVDFSDLDGNLLITNDRFEGMVVRQGRMVLPDGPGLGLKVL